MQKQWKQWQTLFPWAPKSLQMVTATVKLKEVLFGWEVYYKPRPHIKKQRHHSADKSLYKVMVFPPRSHIWMWELDNKEGWAPKNWCFQTVVLEKTFERYFDSREIKPVSPKGYQPWIFIGRTDVAAETQILWLPDVKNWLIRKYPDAGKDWRQEEKRTTEGKMVGWYHWFNGHEFEKSQGDSEGQGRLLCCSSWGLRESDTT